MDISGFNENKATYTEDIFQLITINDILFEIVRYDSSSKDSITYQIYIKIIRKEKLP